MKTTIRAGVLAGLLTLVSAPSALAAPVTVDLRVEGPTRTLVERKVTVDVRTFKFSNSSTTAQCDATGSTGGTAPAPSPTRNGALAEASERTPFEMTGTLFSFGPSFDRINGENVAFNSSTNEFLIEFKNGTASEFGGCADPISNGDDVLYGYGAFGDVPLKLAGPASVAPGASATLTVTDAGAGTPVSGAAAGGRTSGADGRLVTAPLTQRGLNSFKASKTGTIRSNTVSVCVSDGSDGFCGNGTPAAPATPGANPAAPVAGPLFGGDTTTSFAKIASVKEQKTYKLGDAPRELKGTVDEDLVGVDEVRMRISRTDAKRCFKYIGSSDREEFVRTRKCSIKSSRTFKVGEDRSWEYLLPKELEAGRYVLDVIVKDDAGNQTKSYQRGRNRVVFFVK